MNYNDRNLIPAWTEEQGPVIIATVLILAMIVCGVMFFMGWL